MTKHQAIEIILSDRAHYCTTLNYAVNYCKAAMFMEVGSKEFNYQCLLISCNLTSWRHPQAKEVRATLRGKK